MSQANASTDVAAPAAEGWPPRGLSYGDLYRSTLQHEAARHEYRDALTHILGDLTRLQLRTRPTRRAALAHVVRHVDQLISTIKLHCEVDD
jgi:hypothetical protein